MIPFHSSRQGACPWTPAGGCASPKRAAFILLAVTALALQPLQAEIAIPDTVFDFEAWFDASPDAFLDEAAGEFSFSVTQSQYDQLLVDNPDTNTTFAIDLNHFSVVPGTFGSFAFDADDVNAEVTFDPFLGRIKNVWLGLGEPRSLISSTDDFSLGFFWDGLGWQPGNFTVTQTGSNVFGRDFGMEGEMTETVRASGETVEEAILPFAPGVPLPGDELPGVEELFSEEFFIEQPIAIDDTPWQFFDVPSDVWTDPELVDGFFYEIVGEGLFAGILEVDYEGNFELYADGQFVGYFSGDEEIFFEDGGVRSFTIFGLEPPVDGDDPEALPIRLSFDRESASFRQFGLTVVPEPSAFLLLLAATPVLVIGLFLRRRNRR